MLAGPDGRLQAVASTNEAADFLELMQLQAEQGPCLDCVTTGAPVSVADLSDPSAAARWPRLVAIISRAGAFGLAHALPLRLRGQIIGSLNLFHPSPGALPADDLALGQALADIATIAILQERTTHDSHVLTEQLQTALDSRVLIEQAKGVLAHHAGLGADQAFTMLRDYARPRQLRLAALAHQLPTGQLDPNVLTAAAVSEVKTPSRRQTGPAPQPYR